MTMIENRYNLDLLRKRFKESRNKLEFRFIYDTKDNWKTEIWLDLVRNTESKALLKYINYKKYSPRRDAISVQSQKTLIINKERANYLLDNIYGILYTKLILRGYKLRQIKNRVDEVIGNIITEELEKQGLI